MSALFWAMPQLALLARLGAALPPVTPVAAAGADARTDDDAPWRSAPVDPAANPLAGLPALPKTHHSWPLAVNWTDPLMHPVLTDYARITHAVSFSMEYADFADPDNAAVMEAVRICAKTGALIEFNYSPWETDASPFPRHVLPMYEGPEEAAELALFAKKCGDAAALLTAANAKLGTAVNFGGILFDQERWCSDCYDYFNITNVTEAVYRASITRKNNLFYKAATACAPDAHIELYARGAVGRGSGPSATVERTGWRTGGGYYTLEPSELPGAGGSLGVSLYTLPQIGVMRESFNRTVALAKLKGVPSVTPWLSLGAAYRPNFCKHDCASPMYYDMEWNYVSAQHCSRVGVSASGHAGDTGEDSRGGEWSTLFALLHTAAPRMSKARMLRCVCRIWHTTGSSGPKSMTRGTVSARSVSRSGPTQSRSVTQTLSCLRVFAAIHFKIRLPSWLFNTMFPT